MKRFAVKKYLGWFGVFDTTADRISIVFFSPDKQSCEKQCAELNNGIGAGL